jgi:hypothetical protein
MEIKVSVDTGIVLSILRVIENEACRRALPEGPLESFLRDVLRVTERSACEQEAEAEEMLSAFAEMIAAKGEQGKERENGREDD